MQNQQIASAAVIEKVCMLTTGSIHHYVLFGVVGELCGGCRGGKGVSALLNRCTTCSDASGLLILTLSKILESGKTWLCLGVVGQWLVPDTDPEFDSNVSQSFLLSLESPITITRPTKSNCSHHSSWCFIYYSCTWCWSVYYPSDHHETIPNMAIPLHILPAGMLCKEEWLRYIVCVVIFFLQMLPYLTMHFPLTFRKIQPFVSKQNVTTNSCIRFFTSSIALLHHQWSQLLLHLWLLPV